MIYEQMLKESKKIEQTIQQLQKQLTKLPEGNIYCSRTGKYVKWFQSDGKNQIYIPKKKRHLAEQLALKKYFSLQLKNLTREKKAIEFYLRHHDMNASQKEQSLINSLEYQELLTPYFKPILQEISEWMNSPYEKNTQYPEKLIHRTLKGDYVRSKSEMLIDMVLCKNKIPYRYECALQLGEMVVYPDFTIRHPKTGQIYYWEHFGLMDDSNYSRKVFLKLQQYASNGIIPSIHLITTYETKENPLNVDDIEKIVEHYFL